MGINEIDYEPTIEIVPHRPESDGNIIGSRVAGQLPRFTDEELRLGLGEEVDDQIGNLLSRFVSIDLPSGETPQ